MITAVAPELAAAHPEAFGIVPNAVAPSLAAPGRPRRLLEELERRHGGRARLHLGRRGRARTPWAILHGPADRPGAGGRPDAALPASSAARALPYGQGAGERQLLVHGQGSHGAEQREHHQSAEGPLPARSRRVRPAGVEAAIGLAERSEGTAGPRSARCHRRGTTGGSEVSRLPPLPTVAMAHPGRRPGGRLPPPSAPFENTRRDAGGTGGDVGLLPTGPLGRAAFPPRPQGEEEDARPRSHPPAGITRGGLRPSDAALGVAWGGRRPPTCAAPQGARHKGDHARAGSHPARIRARARDRNPRGQRPQGGSGRRSRLGPGPRRGRAPKIGSAGQSYRSPQHLE